MSRPFSLTGEGGCGLILKAPSGLQPKEGAFEDGGI